MTPTPPLARTSRRLALVAAATALGLGGCAGTGMDAQTNAQYQPGIGANVRTGSIQLFNALAVDNGDGTATFSAAVLNRGDAPAKLTGASARGSDGSKIDATTAPAIVAPDQLFNTGKAAAVILKGKDLEAGDYVTVKLNFNGGRSVSIDAPVVARTAIYDDVATNAGGDSSPTEKPEPARPADNAAGDTVPSGAPEPAEPAAH